MSELLSLQQVVVRHTQSGVTAVRGVSLELAPARILALVGESGSGKTTLARAVLQLLPVQSGQVLFRGEDLGAMDAAALRAARRNIQAVFQDPLAALSPRRSVLQTLVEPLRHFRLGTRGDCEARALAALREVGLGSELCRRYPHELSGGQQQRIALARALAVEPALIVADEPLAALDVTAQARIVELFRGLRDRRGIAFLFVAHDLAAVRRLADEIAVMYLGEVVESGPAQTVLSRPAHPYTRALLAAAPAADPGRPAPAVLEGDAPSALAPPPGCVFHPRCCERTSPCEVQTPAETEIAATQPPHRVKCHLWN